MECPNTAETQTPNRWLCRDRAEKHNVRQKTVTTAPPLQLPVPQNVTCCEPWLSGWLLYRHREGGRGGRGLCTGQRPMPSKRDGHASCLQRCLVVSQLVNALLLQQKGLLQGKEAGSCCKSAWCLHKRVFKSF